MLTFLAGVIVGIILVLVVIRLITGPINLYNK